MTAGPPGEKDEPLTGRALRGGRLLMLRQVAGLLLGLATMLALTRLIGPGPYGLYAAAFAVTFFAQTLAELSLDVYLVRHPGELPDRTVHQVFTLLAGFGLAATAMLLALAPLLAGLAGVGEFGAVGAVMAAGLLVMQAQQVPLSLLERRLAYGVISVVEVAGQALFMVVAVGLAVAGAGVWAPVAGWWCQQALLAVGYWSRAGYRPRLARDTARVRDAVGYGLVTTTGTLAYTLRTLVGPLLVLPVLGPAAVGHLALATRLVEQAGFVKNVTLRLSINLLSRVAGDRERLRRVLTRGAELQLLAVGVPVAALAVLAGPLVPWVFGPQWRPAAELLPYLAAAAIVTAAFVLHNAVLMTAARPWAYIASQAASSVLLWTGALLLVPARGLVGYGVAEIGALASFALTHVLLVRRFAAPEYRVLLTWATGLSAAALAPVASWWLLLVTLGCAAAPWSVRRARTLAALVLRRVPVASAPEPVAAP